MCLANTQVENKHRFISESALGVIGESFNQVRRQLPTRCRFRVVDTDGKDIRSSSSVTACKGETHDSSTPAYSTSIHSIRVEYGKPVSGSRGEDDAAGHVAEQSPVYRFNTGRYQVMAL